MRDVDYKSLRREFLGVGITGAMVGLAGCSDSINIETGADDEEDESTETPDIDTAEFSFSYDEAAQQVQIEFTGGAAIIAGNLQIQQDGGKEISWPELGSTTAGIEEPIEPGDTAELGPNILNWEVPIAPDDTIRLIYTGKETPATLERFTPPEPTNTTTTVPASIEKFRLETQSDRQLSVSFTSTTRLETLEINISGSESQSLSIIDFTENQTGPETYTYETSKQVRPEGSYTATVVEAIDENGTDSTSGQSVSDTTSFDTSQEDTTPPSIDAFSIANPSSQMLRVSFDSSEQLSAIQVNITGGESISLTKADFTGTEVESDRYTYEATIETDSSGNFTATLSQATDVNGNDGANNQSVSVAIEDPTNQESNTNSVSFEAASIGANKPADPWSVVNDPTSDDFNSVEISGDHATDGSQSLHMTGNGELDRILVGVNADLSNVAAVRCDVYIEQANVGVGEFWFGRWVNGNSDKRIDFMGQTGEGNNRHNVTGEFTDVEGDMSDLSGEHELVFNMRGDNEAYFDNLRFLDEEGNQISPSTVLVNGDTNNNLSYTFENGKEGWIFGKRRDSRASKGEGSWSEKHGGSLRLHVNGAPETIMAWKEVGSLSKGTIITANYSPERFEYAAAGLFLSAVVPGEGTVVSDRDSDEGDNPEQDGHLEIEIPRDLPANTQLEFKLVIWPGETTVYIQEVESNGDN